MRTEFSRLIVGLALLTPTLLLSSEEAKPATPPRNVVLIGWDGAQCEHVFECRERGELPNLKKLGAVGALTSIDVGGTTDTKAGWAEILERLGVDLSRISPPLDGQSLLARPVSPSDPSPAPR